MSSSIRFQFKLISGLPTNAPRPERVTNRQKDVSVDEGIYIPHNLFGDKMGSVTNILKMTKRVNFCDGVTLTFDTWPWKVEQFGALSLPHFQCFFSYWVNHLCGGWPQHKTITHPPSPHPLNNLKCLEKASFWVKYFLSHLSDKMHSDKQMNKEAWFDNTPNKNRSPIITRVMLLLRSIAVLNIIRIA